jgi:hypothetical protein
VGEDVARAEQREYVVRAGRRVGNVHHHRKAGGAGHVEGALQRPYAVGAHRLPVDPHLDAHHKVGVAGDRVQRRVGVDERQVGGLARTADQAQRRDVQEHGHPHAISGDRGPQRVNPPGPRGARVHPGSDAGLPGHRVRVNAPVSGARVDVRVQVD